MNNYIDVQNRIGYQFKDISLLDTALTHSSYSNENNVPSYERLEFLGDAVIELVVSDYIYKYKELDSGILSKLRASLVSTENLSKISTMLSIMQSVKKSRSLVNFSKKTMADIFESVVGAIYLDSGLESASKIVLKFVVINDEHIQEVLSTCVDYKTKFQEDMQKVGNQFEYRLISSNGLAHDKTFECGLYIEGQLIVSAIGKSIQSAEASCAKKYYETKID